MGDVHPCRTVISTLVAWCLREHWSTSPAISYLLQQPPNTKDSTFGGCRLGRLTW